MKRFMTIAQFEMGWYPRDDVFQFLKTVFLKKPILWCSGGGGAGPGLTFEWAGPTRGANYVLWVRLVVVKFTSLNFYQYFFFNIATGM
jgi:hypothetical protein